MRGGRLGGEKAVFVEFGGTLFDVLIVQMNCNRRSQRMNFGG